MVTFDPSGDPPIGRAVRRWFRRRVAYHLRVTFGRDQLGDNDEHDSAILDWFEERAGRFVYWVPAEVYHGPRFDSGKWVLFAEDAVNAFEGARCETAAARQNTLYPTLEAWLAAESRGDAPAAVAVEPPARCLIPDWALHAFVEQRKRILTANPRECVDCGAEFRPRTAAVTRCPECCTTRRAERHAKRQRGS